MDYAYDARGRLASVSEPGIGGHAAEHLVDVGMREKALHVGNFRPATISLCRNSLVS
ncbi:MAG: hypothetical protein WD342_07455 [Verrucomicrobiales bacterium]